jgi:hypothetical protein
LCKVWIHPQVHKLSSCQAAVARLTSNLSLSSSNIS